MAGSLNQEQALLQKAEVLLNNFREEESLQLYQKALALNPERSRVPGILFTTLPKSASVFITDCLFHGLGLYFIPYGAGVSIKGHLWRTKILSFGGAISHRHLGALPENISIINQYLDKMIVHWRDPRQAILSRLFHILGDRAYYSKNPMIDMGTEYAEHCIYLPENFFNMTFEHQLDWFIPAYFPLQMKWITDWFRVTESPDFRTQILFMMFEDFVKNPVAYFKKILSFYQIASSDFDFSIIKQPVSQKLNFRKGQTDEWQKVLSEQQKKILNDLLSTSSQLERILENTA